MHNSPQDQDHHLDKISSTATTLKQFPPFTPGLDEELQTRVVVGASGQVEGDGSTSSRSAVCASDEVVTGGGSEVTSGGNRINPHIVITLNLPKILIDGQ